MAEERVTNDNIHRRKNVQVIMTSQGQMPLVLARERCLISPASRDE
jgi:hypothetical protein